MQNVGAKASELVVEPRRHTHKPTARRRVRASNAQAAGPLPSASTRLRGEMAITPVSEAGVSSSILGEVTASVVKWSSRSSHEGEFQVRFLAPAHMVV